MRDADISVIIQGGVDQRLSEIDSESLHTIACVRQIRRVLPHAELIFSTWKDDAELKPLVDAFIINVDPGGLLPDGAPKNYLTNFNRQAVSTYNGLHRATRKYALKLRSDSWLTGDGFLRIYQDLLDTWVGAANFQEVVLVAALGCANPVRWPSLFHLTDLFHFGLRTDLMSLWQATPCPVGFAKWHEQSGVPRWRRGSEGERLERMAPEQFLHVDWLARRGIGVAWPDSILGGGYSQYVASERSFLRSFLPYPGKVLGLGLPARLALYDNANHFSYRSDWRMILGMRGDPRLQDIYVRARYPLYLAGLLKWSAKYALRPWLGARARDQWRDRFTSTINLFSKTR